MSNVTCTGDPPVFSCRKEQSSVYEKKIEGALLLKLNSPESAIDGLKLFKKIQHQSVVVFTQCEPPARLTKILPFLERLVKSNLTVMVFGSVALEYLLKSIETFSVVPQVLEGVSRDIDLMINYREDVADILLQENFKLQKKKKQCDFFYTIDPTDRIEITIMTEEHKGKVSLVLPAIISTRLRLLIQKEGHALIFYLIFNPKGYTQDAARLELGGLIQQIMQGIFPFDLPASKQQLRAAIQAPPKSRFASPAFPITLTRLFFSRTVKYIEKYSKIIPNFIPREHSPELRAFFDSEWQQLYFAYLLKITTNNFKPAHEDMTVLISENMSEISFILKNTDESTYSCKILTINKILHSFFSVTMSVNFNPELLRQYIHHSFGMLIFSVLRGTYSSGQMT